MGPGAGNVRPLPEARSGDACQALGKGRFLKVAL